MGGRGLIEVDFQRRMTNNEAEYHTLIEALEYILELLRRKNQDPAQFAVEIRGDSALVLSQVSGAWKARDPRMRQLRDRVRELLARFGTYRLIPVPREVALHYLGH
jgi:ribonuclease HI